MHSFFISIWNDRPHYSEISGKFLGSEALSTFFHHILPKSTYPACAYDKQNIILLTAEEHENVERDMYKYDVVNKKRNELKTKYNII